MRTICARRLRQQRRAAEAVGRAHVERHVGARFDDDTGPSGDSGLSGIQCAAAARAGIRVTIDASSKQYVDARAKRHEILREGAGACGLREVSGVSGGRQSIRRYADGAVARIDEPERLHRPARTGLTRGRAAK